MRVLLGPIVFLLSCSLAKSAPLSYSFPNSMTPETDVQFKIRSYGTTQEITIPTLLESDRFFILPTYRVLSAQVKVEDLAPVSIVNGDTFKVPAMNDDDEVSVIVKIRDSENSEEEKDQIEAAIKKEHPEVAKAVCTNVKNAKELNASLVITSGDKKRIGGVQTFHLLAGEHEKTLTFRCTGKDLAGLAENLRSIADKDALFIPLGGAGGKEATSILDTAQDFSQITIENFPGQQSITQDHVNNFMKYALDRISKTVDRAAIDDKTQLVFLLSNGIYFKTSIGDVKDLTNNHKDYYNTNLETINKSLHDSSSSTQLGGGGSYGFGFISGNGNYAQAHASKDAQDDEMKKAATQATEIDQHLAGDVKSFTTLNLDQMNDALTSADQQFNVIHINHQGYQDSELKEFLSLQGPDVELNKMTGILDWYYEQASKMNRMPLMPPNIDDLIAMPPTTETLTDDQKAKIRGLFKENFGYFHSFPFIPITSWQYTDTQVDHGGYQYRFEAVTDATVIHSPSGEAFSPQYEGVLTFDSTGKITFMKVSVPNLPVAPHIAQPPQVPPLNFYPNLPPVR